MPVIKWAKEIRQVDEAPSTPPEAPSTPPNPKKKKAPSTREFYAAQKPQSAQPKQAPLQAKKRKSEYESDESDPDDLEMMDPEEDEAKISRKQAAQDDIPFSNYEAKARKEGLPELPFPCPWTGRESGHVIVGGITKAGKSHIVRNTLRRDAIRGDFDIVFVISYAPEARQEYNWVAENCLYLNPDEETLDDLYNLICTLGKRGIKSVCVIDDPTGKVEHGSQVQQKLMHFYATIRHEGCSIVMMLQYPKQVANPTIRENAEQVWITKCGMDALDALFPFSLDFASKRAFREYNKENFHYKGLVTIIDRHTDRKVHHYKVSPPADPPKKWRLSSKVPIPKLRGAYQRQK